MKTYKTLLALLIAIAMLIAMTGCNADFPPPSKIDQQRFLGINVEPLEAAPGEEVTFTALVVNSDGTQYEGDIVWAITADSSSTRTEGDSEFDLGDAYLEKPGSEPFVWTVPELDEVEATYGPMGPQGLLMSVVAVAFKGGETAGEPLYSIKLFSVSDRPEDKRMENPAFDDFIVQQHGQRIQPNEDGEYEVDKSDVDLIADSNYGGDDITFHWFAHISEDNFEPDLSSTQELDPAGSGLLYVYCVQRRAYDFSLSDTSKTNLTGIDWRIIPLRID